MCINIKTSNEKKLQLKVLVDSECTQTRIDKQLVKKEQVKMKPINSLFKVFNVDITKNREVTRFIPLKLEINRYIEKINIVVINLNSTDMFLEYNQLVKYNPEFNQNKESIQFTRSLRKYRTKYQNILFTSRTRRLQPMEDMDKEYQEIGKKLDSKTQRIYQNIFNHLYTYLIRRNLRNCQNEENEIMELIYWKIH